MNPIDSALTGIATITASVIGSKAALASTRILADVTNQQLPEWAGLLMGPLGGFAGLVLGLIWMAKRLDKAEKKADARENERDADRKTLITVIEQNSIMLNRVDESLRQK